VAAEAIPPPSTLDLVGAQKSRAAPHAAPATDAKAAAVAPELVQIKGGAAVMVSEEIPAEFAVVATGEPATRWRVIGGLLVERTTDDGRTWVRVESRLPRAVLTGSAPAQNVCWLAGRRGLVLRSEDGASFEVVTAPADADITVVRATDALTASVRTVTGAVYRTSNGGSSWQR
jgi:photosystem II stability/assembly factor-like uncharacterized protein